MLQLKNETHVSTLKIIEKSKKEIYRKVYSHQIKNQKIEDICHPIHAGITKSAGKEKT